MFHQEPRRLYEPMNYILELGGKRMRPMMTLMAAHLFADEVSPALPAAYAVELFHNFSLMHDDIMDQAPLRRGQLTVHEKWDANTAILSGDAMFAQAFMYVAKCEPALLPEVVRIFNEVVLGVCEGQQLDMDFEIRDMVAESEYIRMIELKTAVLPAGAMQLGSLLVGASAEEAVKAYEFGRLIGLAFQIQDDILDSFGDPAKFGKKVGGDIAQNKKTLLVIKSLELGTAAQKAQLAELYATRTQDGTPEEAAKIEAVKDIFRESGALDYALGLKASHHRQGLAMLEAIQVADERKLPLKQLAEMLLEREV